MSYEPVKRLVRAGGLSSLFPAPAGKSTTPPPVRHPASANWCLTGLHFFPESRPQRLGGVASRDRSQEWPSDRRSDKGVIGPRLDTPFRSACRCPLRRITPFIASYSLMTTFSFEICGWPGCTLHTSYLYPRPSPLPQFPDENHS